MATHDSTARKYFIACGLALAALIAAGCMFGAAYVQNSATLYQGDHVGVSLDRLGLTQGDSQHEH